MITPRHLVALLAGSSLCLHSAQAKSVFAHYMLGGIDSSTDHATTDVDQAIAMGFDAFAINVGDATADWAQDALEQLFAAAKGKDFGLFFSFDFYALDDLSGHQALYDQFKDEDAYFKYGPDSLNMVSTFAGSDLGVDTWASFKTDNDVFLVPNVEEASDYYDDPATFFNTWNDALDGVFSWETAWPGNQEQPANVSDSRDEPVKLAGDSHYKAYMMGLSTLQYKHCCGYTYYRSGEVNLPERMTQILDLQPELTEVITWNDAGESHYIGNCWPEALSDDILEYADTDEYPHDGWQPLFTSFIAAYKAGNDASQMAPPGDSPVGAMWYRGVLTSCSGDVPDGAGAGVDAVNYAVVLPAGSADFSVRVSSNGKVLATEAAQGGLNYGSVEGMTTGSQKVEILNAAGTVVATASSLVDVSDGPVGDFCNYNFYVAGLE